MTERAAPTPERPDDRGKLRSFGLLVGGVFALIGFLPMIFRGEPGRAWAWIVGAALAVPALVLPAALRPVYRLWMKVGHVLGYVNNRIILGILFYGIFTPMSLVFKIFKKDPMRRGFDRSGGSYRVPREPRPGGHMEKQF